MLVKKGKNTYLYQSFRDEGVVRTKYHGQLSPQQIHEHLKRKEEEVLGIRLRRDSWMSVMYAEGLNSTTSSGSLQRTDRHGILGQKSSDFQLFL